MRTNRHCAIAWRGPATAVLATLLVSLAPATGADGFAGLSWGDSRDTVVAALGEKPVLDGPRLLVHHDRYAGTRMTINRRFDEDGLWQIRYFNRELHDDYNRYISDYERIRSHLVEEYGEPDVSRKQWQNDRLKERPDHHGAAIAAGDLVYMSGWDTGRTKILMIMQGEQFRVAHHLIFTDPERDPDTVPGSAGD